MREIGAFDQRVTPRNHIHVQTLTAVGRGGPSTLEEQSMSNQNPNQNPNQKPDQQQQGTPRPGQPGQQQGGGGQKPGQQQQDPGHGGQQGDQKR
jgi:hypothetical protein